MACTMNVLRCSRLFFLIFFFLKGKYYFLGRAAESGAACRCRGRVVVGVIVVVVEEFPPRPILCTAPARQLDWNAR